MATAKAVVATPVGGKPNERSGLFELKPLKTVTDNGANKDDQNTSQSQKVFAVSDGPSFEDQAGFLGRWFLLYLDPLFKLGSERTLLHSDLGYISSKDKCSNVQIIFDKFWEIERKKPLKKQSLWMVLWRTAGWCNVLLAVFYYSLYAGISYGPILILNSLVQHFQGTKILSVGVLWFNVALIFALPMAGSMYASMSNIILAHISVQFRNVLVNKIYRKAMVLSPAARQKSSTGQIITMFSNDTKQIQSFLFFLNNILVAPAQIIVALALIYLQVGNATFVGLAFMFFLIPLNGRIFLLLNQIRKLKVKVTDTRVKLMNEILSGIRVLKYYAWERAFSEKVDVVREEELQLLKQLAYVVAIGFTLILMSAPIVQPILIFFTYIKLGNTLDAATAFTTISLFNVMQFPFAFLPMGLAQYSQSLVSTKRMLDFFNAEELTEYVEKDEAQDGSVVSMEKCHMCWILDDAVVDTSKFTPAELKAKEKADKKKVIADDLKAKKDKEEKDKKDAKIKAKKEVKDNALVLLEEGKTGETAADLEAKEKKQMNEIESADDGVNRSLYTLQDVSFSVKKGQLIAVVGAVGSGKSSLLSGLLGEMNLQSGSVRMAGSVAYCDQRPWILNTTVKDNILFGLEYDEKRFDRTVHAASLEDDIKVLPGGVLTEIGERGINLSGGQKARVALARAIYRDADIYLLDDPLSAVDAHVGQHIFHECILGALAGKTRVLVTHQVHLLHLCDLVIVLDQGAVKAFGSYDDLRMSGVDISAFVTHASDKEVEQMKAITASSEPTTWSDVIPPMTPIVNAAIVNFSVKVTNADSAVGLDIDGQDGDVTQADTTDREGDAETDRIIPAEEEQKDSDERHSPSQQLVELDQRISYTVVQPDDACLTEKSSDPPSPSATAVKPSLPATSVGDYAMSAEAEKTAGERKNDGREGTKITTVEEKGEGDVKWKTYSYYINAGGWGKFAGVVFFLLTGQLLAIVSSFWLAFWGEVATREAKKGEPLTSDENTWYLNQFALFSMMGVVGLTLRALVLAQHRLGTSSKLHANLLSATLAAPIAFFDVTPIGRVLNRFSSDMVVVDEELSQTISQLTNSLFSCIGAVGAIAGATKGTFLVLCVPLIFLYERIQRYFRKSNTAIARNQSVSLSPIYADFSQALTGLSSIRAYGEASRFTSSLENRVDYNTIASVMGQLAAQWLAIRLDFIGSLISFFIAVVAVATNGFLPASYLALGLTYSFQMTTYLKFAVRMMATGEAQMNAVERIMYYIDNIEREDDATKKDANGKEFTVPDNWPSSGAIEGKNVHMRYRDGPLVLKGIDFNIRGGEKIGIAGRTGSGKSSMMIALFRIQEACEGQIFVDGIDTATVPLHVLRSKLGIIPQDPVIFSASVRFNLDPFDEHTDAAIWDALSSVDMKEHVLSLPDKLSEEVAEGGDNFSTGQRQLVCIARALLRKPKILVLDEATASIDNQTDELIQKMVRINFKDCTVLTIAHRLHTIIDSDRIIVLDSGVMSEFGAPSDLLANEGGSFRSLWDRHQKSHEGGSRGNSKADLAGMVDEI